MLTTIDQFAGQDIWVYAELEYEDAYIRIEKIFDDGTVIYNAWLPSDSRAKYDLDEILYGELTGDVDSIEIHPLDTLTTEELIAKIEADGKVTASKKFTKYPQGYVNASSEFNGTSGKNTVTFNSVEELYRVLTDDVQDLYCLDDELYLYGYKEIGCIDYQYLDMRELMQLASEAQGMGVEYISALLDSEGCQLDADNCWDFLDGLVGKEFLYANVADLV